MHRAFGRALRGTCRKWRESECPVAAGEEVKRNKEDANKKDFTPPKHSLEEAVTWTAGLVLGYQLTHHRRRNQVLFGDSSSTTVTEKCLTTNVDASSASKSASCPFTASSRVFTQPIFNLGSGLHVKSKAATTVIPSVDVAPFIFDNAHESELPENSRERLSSLSEEDDDDGIVFADDDSPSSEIAEEDLPHAKNNLSFQSSPLSASAAAINSAAEYGRRFGGDLLSVLGAFEFLKAEANAKSTTAAKTGKKAKKKKDSFKNKGVFGKNPPIHAIDLMQKGAELGSGRALYNIGVAYDRMKDTKVAKEYYKKAADLGHPLAIYNCAVLALKDGHLTEGYAMMKSASDFGVPEAKTFLNPPEESLTHQFQNLQVGNA